jgi:hypothetical protein
VTVDAPPATVPATAVPSWLPLALAATVVVVLAAGVAR